MNDYTEQNPVSYRWPFSTTPFRPIAVWSILKQNVIHRCKQADMPKPEIVFLAKQKTWKYFTDSRQGPRPQCYYSGIEIKEREHAQKVQSGPKISNEKIVSELETFQSPCVLCGNSSTCWTACTLINSKYHRKKVWGRDHLHTRDIHTLTLSWWRKCIWVAFLCIKKFGQHTFCQMTSQQKRQPRRVFASGISFKGMYISFWKIRMTFTLTKYL